MTTNDCETFDGCKSLEQFGVIPLTGEACGLAMRVLYNLTEKKCDLIREFLRVEPTAEPWNSKGVKSIMLPVSIFQDLWIFAHVRVGTPNVFLGGYCMGNQWTSTKFESTGEELRHPVKNWTPEAWAVTDPGLLKRLLEQEGECFYTQRWYNRSTHPGTGLDNTHTFTERTK